MTTNDYIGKIKNIGPQTVEAPIKAPVRKSGTVKRGSDLRTSKSSK